MFEGDNYTNRFLPMAFISINSSRESLVWGERRGRRNGKLCILLTMSLILLVLRAFYLGLWEWCEGSPFAKEFLLAGLSKVGEDPQQNPS